MRKTIIFVLCLMLALTAAACSATSSVSTDEGDGSGYSRVTGVTGSGYEYTASVDQDSSVDDPMNQDALDRSYVIQAVQGDEVIYPRGEIEAETVEEDKAYEMIDAGGMINCDYWFPVDASQPVTIQILNIDGEDTVMAELTFPVSQED